jgi:uncharacterized membrane protein
MTTPQRPVQTPSPGARYPAVPPPGSDRAARTGDRIVLGIVRHWVAIFGLGLFVYVGLPFLAPALMHVGLTGPARLLYLVYSPACHQLPDRSYFLFGQHPVYTLEELEEANVLTGSGLLERRRFIGDETLGWKVALCERDVAIYGSMLLAGIIFALLRGRVRRLPLPVFVLFIIPIAVDGLTQLFGLRTSNWWLRTLTGVLFGAGVVWLVYPYIQESMDDIRSSIEKKRGL